MDSASRSIASVLAPKIYRAGNDTFALIAGITFIVGSLLIKKTSGNKIWEESQVTEKRNGTLG